MATGDLSDLDPYYESVIAARSLLDRREVLLYRMLFNLRVVVTDGPHSLVYDDGYCFHNAAAAWKTFETWDGESEPDGWAKNPFTGRRGPCACRDCNANRSEAIGRGAQW